VDVVEALRIAKQQFATVPRLDPVEAAEIYFKVSAAPN
jgi:hypothetical protein